MKIILNYRYYIIAILFTIGLLGILRAFGDPASDISEAEWYLQTTGSMLIGFLSFYALHRCTKYWERRGTIPEITDLKSEI